MSAAAASTAARVEELSAELAGIKDAHREETARLTDAHKEELSRSLRAGAEEMRAATDLMSEIEASRAKDIEAARASFAGRIEALELELAQARAYHVLRRLVRRRTCAYHGVRAPPRAHCSSPCVGP